MSTEKYDRENVVTRVLRHLIDEGRAAILTRYGPTHHALAGGDRAVVEALVRAGIGAITTTDLDPLTALRLCGRPVVFSCGLTLVAHYTAPYRRALIAVDRDRVWAIPVELLPAIVEAVTACESAEEAVGAIRGLVSS